MTTNDKARQQILATYRVVPLPSWWPDADIEPDRWMAEWHALNRARQAKARRERRVHLWGGNQDRYT
ncbi:hypothetical protein [Spongiactinospora sp. 9N601]|uniref:hypothetical protein n=1 Tax=Spongiactinospora sp. 9N601 TaxID=3375149 RepID=UPI0037AB4C5A